MSELFQNPIEKIVKTEPNEIPLTHIHDSAVVYMIWYRYFNKNSGVQLML